MKRLEGKVAIVTGSTSGIGVGIAKLFAQEGAKVVICGRREAKGQAVVDAIVKEGGEAYYHFMDITVVESIDALFKDTVEKYGKIDILVNNAANVGLKDGRVDELTLEMWDNIFASDIRGTFYAIKTVLPYLRENKGGSIINIGSMASCGGDLGSTAYACAKAGVDMLTKSTALQYGKENIRCKCVRPGLIVTPENAQSLLDQDLPLVLDFSATWCGPCRKVSPIMDELAEEFAGRVVVAKADVDECEDLAIDFKVRNVPTILFIKDGKVVDKQTGAASKNVFAEKINALLG